MGDNIRGKEQVMKKNKEELIGIGSVVITTYHRLEPEYIGEVSGIVKSRLNNFYELILYDKRLKPITRGDGSFRIKRMPQNDCKLLDESFKLKFDSSSIELGDIICKGCNFSTAKKYGVVVGFTHPDGLLSTSYSNGYNGTDLIDCVEIEKKGLRRRRDASGQLHRFSTTSAQTSSCEVDLWSRGGPKIITK